MTDAAIEGLVDELTAARRTAEGLAGRPPLGIRAIEPGAGQRWYLCAFDGPSFLCLTREMTAEADRLRARQAAAAALVVEAAEAMIDRDELRLLARAAGRVLAEPASDALGLGPSVGQVAEEALGLVVWAEAPERALASLVALDAGIHRHERLREAYRRFVEASDPLVARQDGLPAELVTALRELEEAAGRAGIGDSLAQRLGTAIADCDEGAEEMLAGHLTALG